MLEGSLCGSRNECITCFKFLGDDGVRTLGEFITSMSG